MAMTATSTKEPAHTHRADLLNRLRQTQACDVVVIGGGATGLGVALDAALRGLRVVLIEAQDFAKGTSSRATKLVHGGVRYLAQGNISLVREALHERRSLLDNAAHLAQPLSFVMPAQQWWEVPFYGAGLKVYDLLAGAAGLGSTQFLSRTKTTTLLPGVNPQRVCGGVQYWDGQFDDARLALALARTAAAQGALMLNYMRATGLQYEGGRVVGVKCQDAHTAEEFSLKAACVINATGVWVDTLLQEDARANGRSVTPVVTPSQGVHVVVDAHFWPGPHALLVPKTQDGRVLFAVPWLGKVILGTTDAARPDAVYEPQASEEEIGFILKEAARYLRQAPQRSDVRSVWVGLRPLVKPQKNADGSTGSVSREHTVLVSESGMVSVTGGKWTTYRAMAEDVLNRCQQAGLLPSTLPASTTQSHRLVGAPDPAQHQESVGHAPGNHIYGLERPWLEQLPGADHWIAPGLSEAMVRFAARHEYARTVEDILARRSRLLFLDAQAAATAAPAVAHILEQELGQAVDTAEFERLAAQYAGRG